MDRKPPRVFISYSHDSDAHKRRVGELAADLHIHAGVECVFDDIVMAPPGGFPQWMLNEIGAADFVISVCTPEYRRRFESKTHAKTGAGAKFEGRVITQQIFEAAGAPHKFVPVLLDGASDDGVPEVLRPDRHFRWPAQREDLKFRLHGREPRVLPPSNPSPDLSPTVIGSDSPAATLASDFPTWTGSAAYLAAKYGRVPVPSLAVSITPYGPHPQPAKKLAFLDHVRRAPLGQAFLDEALFTPLSTLELERHDAGLLWHEPSVGMGQLGRTLAVGFDGSLFFEITMWESRRADLEWGADGVDVGSVVDVVLGTTLLASHVWSANQEARPGWVTVELSGIRNRHLVYSQCRGTPQVTRMVPTRRFAMDARSRAFRMPATFDAEALAEGLNKVWDELGYPTQHDVDSAYVKRRIEARLALL